MTLAPRQPSPRAPVLLLALLLTAAGLTGCEEPEDATMPAAAPVPVHDREPPLKPLIYIESPDYTPARARDFEEAVLTTFVQDGRIIDPAEAPPAPEVAAAEPAPAPRPPDAADKAPAPGAEAPTDPPPSVPPPAAASSFATPEALSEAVFGAILEQSERRFFNLLIDPEGLMALAGVGPRTAEERVAALEKSSLRTYAVFTPGNASEEPAGGLASKLVMTEIRLGTAGTRRGKKPRADEDTVQYWGTEVAFRLQPAKDAPLSNVEFTLSLPRVLKLPDGTWRLAAAPRVSSNFETYLDAGLHLKAELLAPEHHEYPMSVGNFWRYRVRHPDRTDSADDLVLGAQDNAETLQVEVTEVTRYDGYRVITLRQTVHAQTTQTSHFYYLVTPRRLYRCDGYCKARTDQLTYVLEHIRLNTPLLVFPLHEAMAWTKGGRVVFENSRYNAQEKRETCTVPAGEFSDSVVIEGRISGGAETRYFKPGLGMVQRIARGATGTRIEELIEYRVLNTD